VFHELVSRNDDLKSLVDKGYSVSFDSAYLVVGDIPYLDAEKKLHWGAIVTKLTFVDQTRIGPPEDHQVFFCGAHPHTIDGAPIANLGGGPHGLALANPNTVVQRSFSNKPVAGPAFGNFFDKVESYVAIISGPAMTLHQVSPFKFRIDPNIVGGSVFKFHDTLTSRAEIGDLAKKLNDDVIAIIGLGGTGAYVLDFLVKAPVREIRGFDGDHFHVHNSYRSPGRLDPTEFGLSKARVHASRYDNFRDGLTLVSKFVDASSADDVDGVTFAFVCVDKGPSRAEVFALLQAKGIPYVDVGMGLDRRRGSIGGQMRVTHYSVDRGPAMLARQLVDLSDAPDDNYRTNVQIAELNALNAALAVIRYKQLRGFYADEAAFEHMLLGLHDLHIVGESYQ